MIMKKIKFVIMAVLITLPIYAQKNTNVSATKEFFEYSPDFQWRQLEGSLPEKEDLVFDVYWKFVKVGKGTLEIKGIEEVNGRTAYHIYSEAKSAPFFDNFFKVRDTNQSWIDTESLCSLRYLTNISEGGWKKFEQLDFNHQNARFARNDDGKMKYGDTVQWVQDVISSLYYMRTMDLEVGKEYVFEAHSGDDTWPLKTKVIGREKVKVEAGTFDCLILQPMIREDAGIFKAKGKLKVWVTNDERKMPVQMRSKIPVGSICAELSTYKTENKIKQEETIAKEISSEEETTIE
ncbi:MAG: DUF3108 domain-containing protein [Elusimicrobia bacterium]|nr:DUF3108 domain-containing protein [Elusimicrobiota bacterium]